RQLRQSQVLVLPSQSNPGWREQIGLPIMEALAHGCSVVTTSDTGLAQWLTEHGHSVISSSGSASHLADAMVTRLRAPLDESEVLASLPGRDGRLVADDWLFGPHP
ncbi:MAG TPA: glycosyltransferase, partial [Propionibacteriaceae bacterium]